MAAEALSTPPDAEALDAYSRVVTTVARELAPSVANLRVRTRTRRGAALGGGSASVLAAHGYLVTAARWSTAAGASSASTPRWRGSASGSPCRSTRRRGGSSALS